MRPPKRLVVLRNGARIRIADAPVITSLYPQDDDRSRYLLSCRSVVRPARSNLRLTQPKLQAVEWESEFIHYDIARRLIVSALQESTL